MAIEYRGEETLFVVEIEDIQATKLIRPFNLNLGVAVS